MKITQITTTKVKPQDINMKKPTHKYHKYKTEMFNKKLKVQRSQANTVCYSPLLLFHPVSPTVAFSSRPPPHQVHRSEANVICKLEHKSVYVREVCLAEVTSAQAVFALNHINLKCPFSCLLSKESFSIDFPNLPSPGSMFSHIIPGL